MPGTMWFPAIFLRVINNSFNQVYLTAYFRPQ
jgi:hypothetical protein